jgi:hypothetical protein
VKRFVPTKGFEAANNRRAAGALFDGTGSRGASACRAGSGSFRKRNVSARASGKV